MLILRSFDITVLTTTCKNAKNDLLCSSLRFFEYKFFLKRLISTSNHNCYINLCFSKNSKQGGSLLEFAQNEPFVTLKTNLLFNNNVILTLQV